MTVQQRPILIEAESRAVRRGVPDPGIPTPTMARPTIALFFATLGFWALGTWLLFTERASAWLLIPMFTAVTFWMFTVLHECAHHAAGRANWVNEVFGRLSMVYMASFASFPALRHVHIEHHRHTNEDRAIDPDTWSTHGPALLMPLRWATQDLYYVVFWAKRINRRPKAEVAETLFTAGATVGVIAWAALGGWFWELSVWYLIPQRLGLFTLAWWFDWLPHHGLSATSASDRYRATRIRVGMEWLMTPGLLYQNYHLVHHLHPSIPFYRYITAWNKNRDTYLSRESAIITAWGRELSPTEYRAWRNITASYDETVGTSSDGASVHELAIDEIIPLTDDAVSISFAVPEHLREDFRFTPGQHITLHVPVDGQTQRRTYSICASATSGVVRIGVKRIEAGLVSTHLATRAAVGDVIGVEPPAGRFVLSPDPRSARQYVGIAGGSGITPIISMLATSLLLEEHSTFTLLYANRSEQSTMFADDLRMLERQFEGRLRIVHLLDGADDAEIARLSAAVEAVQDDERRGTTSYLGGMLTPERVAALIPEAAAIDGWFLCGPQPMVRGIRESLIADGIGTDRVHLELFKPEVTERIHLGRDTPTTVTALLRGKRTTFAVDGGQSVLDGALDSSVDAPYACMGGACGTCRAKVIAGTLDMDQNLVLSDAEVTQGYVLTCQSYPSSDYLDIDYDA